MFEPKLEGILAIAALVLCGVLAVVLFRVGTPNSVARKLSLLLVFEALTLGSSDSPFTVLANLNDYIAAYPWLPVVQSIVHTFGDCGMIALYPPFLAAALRTKLTRPFAGKRGQRLSLAFGVGLFTYVIGSTTLGIGSGVAFPILYLSMAILFMYAFVASVHAWYVAEDSERLKARVFTLAFGFRDVCWNIVYIAALWGVWIQAEWMEHDNLSLVFVLYPLGTLVAVPLIAYGILRTQLFDIDLKLRWTIKQSTFAVFVVAITFVISEGVEMFVAAELGDAWGLVAAAVALLFLKPLQSLAERFVSRLMPETVNTEAYRSSRKAEVYREAVTEVYADGDVSEREVALLRRLRDSLGVSEESARAIEHGISARLGG